MRANTSQSLIQQPCKRGAADDSDMYKHSSPYTDPFAEVGEQSDDELEPDLPAVQCAFASVQLESSPQHGTSEEKRKLQLTRFVQQCKGERRALPYCVHFRRTVYPALV